MATGGTHHHILQRTQKTIEAYQTEHDEGQDAPIRDLLADLMHWCKFKGLDFENELSMATEFFGDEEAEQEG